MLQAQRSWGIKSRWQKCNSMGRWLGLTARGFVSVYLGWSLGICISHKYSFDYDTAALRTTFREPPLHSRNRDSPIAQLVKNLPANAGDGSSILGSRRSPGERNCNPLQYSYLGNPTQRSLVDYSPWGCKESDMT